MRKIIKKDKMKLREDGEIISTEQELKELLVRIRDKSLNSSLDTSEFILWIKKILIDHPLLES